MDRDGTVRHDHSPPETTLHQSVATRGHSARALFRSQRLRDLLSAIAEWERASGPDRTYWRRDARHRLAEWRRLHREPEMRAFRAAVARSQAARP